MGSTRLQLAEYVREEIGDKIRASGVADAGSSESLLVDSSVLVQNDEHWKGMTLNISDTTDDGAPKGESRKISGNSLTSNSVSTEIPLSASLEAGDSWEISYFASSQIFRAINNAIETLSIYKPEVKSVNFTTSVGENRFSVTDGENMSALLWVEYRNASKQKQTRYDNAFWNAELEVIEFPFFWSDAKQLTAYFSRPHKQLTSDSQEVTVKAAHERFIVNLAVADLMLSMSALQIKDDFGKLRPKSKKRGDVSTTYESVQDTFISMRKDIIESIEKQLSSTVVISKTVNQSFVPGKNGQSIYRNAKPDPDGELPGQFFLHT